MNRRDTPAAGFGSLATYAVGFAVSLGLTLTSFWLVHKHIANHHLSPTDNFMLAALAVLALTQLLVQLTFFLHLDREPKPRWNLQVFAFMLAILLILVIGSLWIMSHLNYRMENSPQQVNRYLQSQDGM